MCQRSQKIPIRTKKGIKVKLTCGYWPILISAVYQMSSKSGKRLKIHV